MYRKIHTKPAKTRFFDFVLLTPEEYEKLKAKFGEKEAIDKMECLNDYIGSKNKRYASHYFTILTWARKAEKDKSNPAVAFNQPGGYYKAPETPKNPVNMKDIADKFREDGLI